MGIAASPAFAMNPRHGEVRQPLAQKAGGPMVAVPKPSHLALLGAGLTFITVATYFPIFAANFVCFDDPDYVTRNPHVLSGVSLANINWAFTKFYDCNWHPLTWISHMADSQIYGLAPMGHHVTNLVFHAVNSVLLFLFLYWLTHAAWRSAFVAALFALHPLHVESVAWVAERKDVLSTFFGLLTLWAYSQYARSSGSTALKPATPGLSQAASVPAPRRYLWYSLALGLFCLGLLSKPMLVTWPFVMLLLDYWPLDRLHAGRAGARSLFKTCNRLLLEKIPFFAMSIASSVITVMAQRAGGATVATTTLPFSVRLANAALAYLAYLGKLIWPRDLAVCYPYDLNWSSLQVALTMFLLIGLSALLMHRRKERPYMFAGWVWFLGTLVPVIGLVQVGNQPIADRYTYIPAIGIFIMVSWGAHEFLKRRSWLIVFGGATVLGCALWTRVQLAYWQDSRTLFLHALAVTKNNFIAHNNLGFYFLEQGQFGEAQKCYETSISINPTYAPAWHNLGLALCAQGKYSESLTNYEAALRLNPQLFATHLQLAITLARLGKIPEAISHYDEVLRINPDDLSARLGLGQALAQAGKLDDAIGQFNEALRMNPDFQDARLQLGITFAMQGKLDQAAAIFTEGLKRQPEAPLFHYHLAQILTRLGRYQETISHYHGALKKSPNFVEALNNAAWMLATSPESQVRDGSEAVRLAEHACELTKNEQPLLLGTLAAAYAEAGRFKDAIASAEKARSLATAAGQTDVADTNSKLLELYRLDKPYRDLPKEPAP